ncbi:MAG: hypothetical protein ACTSO3_01325 [Candidatus Heimdallarchaeaceae archaeon]
MENYYEINVSLNGSHFFATDSRSIKTEKDLKKILPIIKEKFPEEEGYEIFCHYWEAAGNEVDVIDGKLFY